MTDRTKQWIEATKSLGFPITVCLMLMLCIIVPMFWVYMGVVEKTVKTQDDICKIQNQMAIAMDRMSTAQVQQTRTLEELTRLSQRSADCLQRVESALREADRQSGAMRAPPGIPGS